MCLCSKSVVGSILMAAAGGFSAAMIAESVTYVPLEMHKVNVTKTNNAFLSWLDARQNK